ncbi:carboxylate--amine ligase [Brachybacterium huguangmaarense]|uniref:Carboxylate--amine ligase n=1 Tax=Brachybacterium huguangmaarense TaxID=1652028 RepID=A0ABY6G0X0_9MICO|nr:carboxylate--amine ligase [Brachybacterium huguangmaarense]UYG16725.1 carboxylate--amine ligase [Brachybacterium huguangmaarense]
MPDATASSSSAAPDFDLVLAGSGLGVYTLARAFHEEYGVVATVVTKIAVEAMRRSVACNVIELGARADEDDMVARLVSLAEERGGRRPQLLLANADSVIQMMSDHREPLAAHYVMPILDADVLERLSDKAEFALACAEHGVATPVTEIVDVADARGTSWTPPATRIPFPVVVKAARTADMAHVRFAGKKKVWFVESAAELDELLRTIARAGYTGRVVVQELVPGDDTTECSITAYTDRHGRVTLLCSARVLLGEHTPDALGRPAAMITTPLPEALEQARRLLEATGYRGFANFDVKEDPRDGSLKFFEVNPRIGRNNFYVTAAGANISRFVVADAIEDREIEPVTEVDEILYSLVPTPLLLRYVRDRGMRRWVRRVARRGVENPWAYPADGLWARGYAATVALNHVRKFLRYYPRPTDTGF